MSAKNLYDQIFYDRAIWYVKFAWLPQKCDLTGKRIWFKRAYQGWVMYTGPGSPIIKTRWITTEEFLFAKLSGKI